MKSAPGAARHRLLYRLLGLLLAGVGVVCLALIVPVWGALPYEGRAGAQGEPGLAFLLGLFLLATGVALLATAWYVYYRLPHQEDFREAYDKAEQQRFKAWLIRRRLWRTRRGPGQ